MVGTPRAHPGMVLTCDTKAVPSDVWWLLISTWYMLIQHSLRRISARRCQTEEVEGCTHKYKTIDPPSSRWLFHLELSGAAGKGFNTVWDKQTWRSSPSFCQYLCWVVLDYSICLHKLLSPQQQWAQHHWILGGVCRGMLSCPAVPWHWCLWSLRRTEGS